MAKKDKNEKPKKMTEGSNKVLFIWGGIILLIIALFTMQGGGRAKPEEMSVQDVIRATEEGRILEGQITPKRSAGQDYFTIQGRMYPKGYDPQDTSLTTNEAIKQDVINFVAIGRLTEERFENLMQFDGWKEKAESTLMQELLLGLLPFLLIILLLYFLFTRQLKMAGKGAMSFGKSKAKMLTRDREKVTFKEVAGCDEAKEEVSEIVDFLRDPKKFQKIGGRIPKGCLMVGSPGTGKTLLARAVAGEADVPFFSISGSDFVEMFVGVGAARVRDMFEQGRKNAPCILFIDEIDAVGRQRGTGMGGGNDEREQTLNSLLVEMDGFDGHEGVIIIAATNRPDVLDKALLRPGRFDRQITIDLPDVNGREEILKVHAKKIQLADEIELSAIARNTPGFSGADLANLLNEGALLAARYNEEKVTMAHINEARDKISYGRERKRLMDTKDKEITAYHEAGHAIVAGVTEDKLMDVHKVTIIPRGQSLGSTMFSPKKDILNYPLSHLKNQIALAMGGRIAEKIKFDEITSGASGDIRMATDLARRMVCDWGMSELGPVAFGEREEHHFLGRSSSRSPDFSEQTAQRVDAEIAKIIDEGYQRAEQILTEHREALDILSLALIEHETLEGKHVLEILEHGEIRSPIVKLPPPLPKEEESKPEADKVKKPKKTDPDFGGAAVEGSPA